MRIEHIYRRVDQQRSIGNEITTAYAKLVSIGEENVTKNRLEIRLQALKDSWQTFSANHQAINLAIPLVSNEEQRKLKRRSYFSNEMYSTVYESYLEALEKIQTLLDGHNALQISNNRGASSPVSISSTPIRPTAVYQPMHHIARLPRIDVPKFSGNLADWLSFKGLFTSLVLANPSLSSVEKLQYLKTHLIGHASHVLKNTSVTDENFEPAWDAVTAYYENDRRLVHSAIQSMFNAKSMTRESASEMERLYTTFEQAYRTLEALKRPVEHCDDFLVFLITQKLDPDSAKAWELSQGASRQPATWAQMRGFLTTRIGSIQAYESAQPSKGSKPWLSKSQYPTVRSHHASSETNNQQEIYNDDTCPLCSEHHFLSYCHKFEGLTVKQRYDFVIKKRLCFNCLRPHRLALCRSTRRCTRCGKRHHTMIHQNTLKPNTVAVTKETETVESEVIKQANHINTDVQIKIGSTVLLATAQIKIINQNGEILQVRALLDQGSEISLISESLAQRLCLKRRSSSVSVIGVGSASTNRTKGQVTINIKPHFSSSFQVELKPYILPKLTGNLPSSCLQKVTWPHLKDLQLADPLFTKPGPIDVLIGADVYGQLLQGSVVKGPSDAPVAQLTSLGWIISGPTPVSTRNNMNVHHCTVDHDLSKSLEKFWHQEEVPGVHSTTLSPSDQECEEHFLATHSRNHEGRYVVRLPLKGPITLLGDSLKVAHQTLESLQRRCNQNLQFSTMYSAFLKEYEVLGHMEQISEDSNEVQRKFYLPHHGVIKESSITTKLRVVFNGSCKVSSGLPINELLHTGAKLQTDVVDVFIWLRQFKYIFSSDIEKMYRQIAVHKDDQDLQRILWIDANNEVVKYRLTTVTYGLACAPFLALRVLLQLIKDEGKNFPQASEVLTKGRYVDDIFGGAHTIQEAQEKADQVNQMCMAGGFPLRKWRSNHPDVLCHIPAKYQLPTARVSIHEDIVQALGLSWNPSLDTIQFDMKTTSTATTKRGVLSRISQFFDPLGFLAPILIRFKIFMQELWTIKLGWDEHLADPQVTVWTNLLQQLDGLENISIPRWTGYEPNCEVQLHGFCDASQLAMAAAVYLRTQNSNGNVTTQLVCAKTRVAPLKRMTIPRLELTAAVILVKLIKHCQQVLTLEKTSTYLWTDSSIVYTWLNNHPSKWKDFIHNRVCYIQETLPHGQWRHISGKINPADCATRGLSATELLRHSLWWNGPTWLRQPSSSWPQSLPASVHQHHELEIRTSVPKIVALVHQPITWELLSRYSSLTRLLQITALCIQIVKIWRKKINLPLGTYITSERIQEATIYWIRTVQQKEFYTEIQTLLKGQRLPNASAVLRLLPFVDGNGLLRVGGRLHNSDLPMDSKHPYILPKCSPLSTLVIRDAHLKTFHGSTQETLNYIRNRYWIIGGRAPVRAFIHKCITCLRYRQHQSQQMMGQLPSTRVTPSRAFLNTGVDYAGPFTIKAWKGRGAKTYKAWVSLFVCQTTSAIHLELVTDYTADAFIAAFRRFISRRGIPATMSSDCGTNFKGAAQELKTLFNQTSEELKEIAASIAQDGTTWNFNPPASPHFGGKWEAGVKLMKHHLKRVVGEDLLTYEEMTTVLTQIEGILNSRPLCPLTDDPEDLEVLTPGHFLIGESLQTIPEPTLTDVPINHLSRWQLLSQKIQSFWKKWSKEYLQRYQLVYKWKHPVPITEGMLVLLMDERYPPSKWPRGRIIKTHPGKDNIVRVVTIKMGSTTLSRPVTKLCILPIQANDINSLNLGGSKGAGNV